ncbi:uncharacterized protein NECHADRAFT_42845 [Fusarium vanettenii 77-13-4]|uniref:MalT-like TPR region domain-containing protein n=1 Tax=Fusarium vanettenii (strain ATCC MYA-4622 / CBS 123669 / FGSC 9596 / NRRL 45880 / 77-13-4) TaxID=660122 RepID=C7ZAI9_FUSV7|nr:uncharacterized protein NECHADRAFT_42845 [Fusarium vanettenii 77-13-4]EEU39686.1 hypothetical protein NECHADRAFT_42845 [Fusarium vanettenii 77-13-4]
MCLCNTVRQLAKEYDETKADSIAAELNHHLSAVRSILSKSKLLARTTQYHIIPTNQRTAKILSIQSCNSDRVNDVYERFRFDLEGFWTPSDTLAHVELHRRLACIVIFLRSELNASVLVPPRIARYFEVQKDSELRHAGRKYIKMARRLGSIGSVLWLPLDIPFSTYERYVNINDEEIFSHLKSICSGAPSRDEFVRNLILGQLKDPSLPLSYHNLFVNYADVLADTDILLLLLEALGGHNIPDTLLRSVSSPQRRWNADGEIQTTDATQYGLPVELVDVLSDNTRLAQSLTSVYIKKHTLDDGTVTWSLDPVSNPQLFSNLLPDVAEFLRSVALKLLCFACPPCYEGNTTWSPQTKSLVWDLMHKLIQENNKITISLKDQFVDALLYFSERDSFSIRCLATHIAGAFLRPSMPYYLHASVTLFQSLVYRLEGDFIESDAHIRHFLCQTRRPITRRDHALKGRLHLVVIENKIQRHDSDTALRIYEWKAEHPPSNLELEVTRRLQGVAASFFQSMGDFDNARESLEQYLNLGAVQPIRTTTRRLIVARLADIYCEIGWYDKANELLGAELENMREPDKRSRPCRRLMLASVEANIGQGRTDIADSTIQDLAMIEPAGLEEMNDQLLRMRRLMATARVAHQKGHFQDALHLWKSTLQEMKQFTAFHAKYGFIAVVIHLSIAHTQIELGDVEDGKRSWDTAADMLRSQRCEYGIPIVATSWLKTVAGAIHQLKGWPLRIMVPGKKPDLTWV